MVVILEPYFKTKYGTLYCGDALKIIDNLNVKVDAVITDPPYGSKVFGWDGVDVEFHICFLNKVINVMKEGAPIFMFYPPMRLHEILPEFTKLFKLRNIVVWHHPNIYAYGKVYGTDRFKSTWEAILYGIKGDRPKAINANTCLYRNYGKSFDVIIMPAPNKPLHPAQKPEKLIEMLINCFTNPSDIVLDPFLGSGTTAIVAERLGRRWIGIEISKEFCDLCISRLKTGFSIDWW